MIRKFAVALTFSLGAACIATFFVLKAPQEPEALEMPWQSSFRLETLQLDTAALGTVSAWNDGLVVGNARGELRIFPRLEPGVEPIVHQVSTYAISAAPLEQDGVFYVGDENGRFWAFDPALGVKWFHKTRNQVTGRAIFRDGLVLVGSHSQSLFAFEPESGELKYSIDCNGEINGSPLFSEQEHAVVFGSCDGLLRKIDLHTGNVVMEIDFESMIPDTPAFRDGILYLPTNGGDLAAVDAASFEMLYRVSTGDAYFSSPYATESFLFLTDMHGNIAVHRRSTGERLATLETEEKMTTLQAGDDDEVFAVSRRGKLYRWRREGERWHRTLLADCQTDCRRGCIFLGEKLVVVDDSGGLYYVETTRRETTR